MSVKGSIKAGAKYISRKRVKGKWVYKYKDKKLAIKRPKIKDYYREGVHRYFRTEAEKKEFLRKQKLGMAGGKGQKILTAERIKIGTAVTFDFAGEKFSGKVIATDGTSSTAPKHFDIQFISSGQTYIRKNVPKEAVRRKDKSWLQQQKEKAKKKKLVLQSEVRAMETKAISEKVKEQARDLVEANWDIFEKTAGVYYNSRIKGGWDASKFGFTQDDLKMETALIVLKAAQSYLTNKPKDKRSTFKSYVLSFLKANLASALAVGSGGGGHLKASQKNQMYLWFFKDTLDEYRKAHKNKIPSDAEMVDFLEKKRKLLPNEKGNRTFISYKWNVEKVRNAKKQTKKMESLQRLVDNAKSGTAVTMMALLNDEEIETFGHYRIDPWVETQKIVVRDSVKKSLNRIFGNSLDKQILIRRFGLFIDENSPSSLRRYAQGWNPGEVANYLNGVERRTGSRKTWTSSMVVDREEKLLRKLKEDEKFKRELEDFVKSKQNKEWSDEALLIYWIVIYQIIEKLINKFFPEPIEIRSESLGDEGIEDIKSNIKLGIKKMVDI